MSYPAAMQALLDQFGNQNAIAQKIVQVGSFQPFDLVRVHSNPANLVLTNAHEGSVATSTVVLLTDGQARAGLKFKPDTSVIRDRHDQQLHLIIASGIDQVVTVEFEDYPAKELQVTANQPALFSIGMLFGIPVIASTASFFDVATGETGGSSGNSSVPVFNMLINAVQNQNSIHYTGGALPTNTTWDGFLGFLGIKKINELESFSFKVPALTGSQELLVVMCSVGSPTKEDSLALTKVYSLGGGELGGAIYTNGFTEFPATVNDPLTVTRNGGRLTITLNDGSSYQTAENVNIASDAWLHLVIRSSEAEVPDLIINSVTEQG